jgi:hypothetical protein
MCKHNFFCVCFCVVCCSCVRFVSYLRVYFSFGFVSLPVILCLFVLVIYWYLLWCIFVFLVFSLYPLRYICRTPFAFSNLLANASRVQPLLACRFLKSAPRPLLSSYWSSCHLFVGPPRIFRSLLYIYWLIMFSCAALFKLFLIIDPQWLCLFLAPLLRCYRLVYTCSKLGLIF